ncbi:MAG TPA: gluconate 2-dehydrogenase subunit 3 family protein [Gemmatimonadaceae bacterium]
MQRRDLLRAFGATAALAMVPREAVAAWTRVATGARPADGLTDAQLALVGAIADTILPRSDSPSATDVAVPAFINVIVSENYTDADRQTFVAGLDAIEAHVKMNAGAPFTNLSAEKRGDAIGAIEALGDRRAEPSRTYWRLKGLVVHGYFTSERVMKEVLHHEIMPGKYDGNAPMPSKVARPGGHSHG